MAILLCAASSYSLSPLMTSLDPICPTDHRVHACMTRFIRGMPDFWAMTANYISRLGMSWV